MQGTPDCPPEGSRVLYRLASPMDEQDLDDSLVVDVVAWVLYAGWLSMLVYVVLWLGVEPLPTLQRKVGTAGALAAGVAFLVGSRWVYDRMRARAEAGAAKGPPGD